MWKWLAKRLLPVLLPIIIAEIEKWLEKQELIRR